MLRIPDASISRAISNAGTGNSGPHSHTVAIPDAKRSTADGVCRRDNGAAGHTDAVSNLRGSDSGGSTTGYTHPSLGRPTTNARN